MNYSVTSESLEDTAEFAQKLASLLKGGEVIQLVGDIGAGKTTFTKSLVEALDSKDMVTSPTFTICNKYTGKYTIYHCDFYRLNDDKLIEQELADLIGDENIVVVEWGENIKLIDKVEHVLIKIELSEDQKRKFIVSAEDKYNYLKV